MSVARNLHSGAERSPVSMTCLHEGLAGLTIDATADCGLDDVSLRVIAARAGTSTNAIFQAYSGKAELLEDAVRLAVARDIEFHREMSGQVRDAVHGPVAFADFLIAYLDLRVSRPEARFLDEILINAEDMPHCRALLHDWHTARTVFWSALVGQQQAADSKLPKIISDYVLMEEIYAHALNGDVQYRLLRSETCRALCEASLAGGGGRSEPSAGPALAVNPMPIEHPHGDAGHAMADHLLQAAVDIVTRSGLSALNQRAVAKKVGVSSSALTYHFGDMKTFTTQALWRALVRQLPSQFDPTQAPRDFPRTQAGWLAMLDDLLDPDGREGDSGFYIGFSRLTAQASLLACRDALLLPLMLYLRKLEGWGTFRVTRHIAPLDGQVRRDHAAAFAIWVKAEALLRAAGLHDDRAGLFRLDEAAGVIFPAANPGQAPA